MNSLLLLVSSCKSLSFRIVLPVPDSDFLPTTEDIPSESDDDPSAPLAKSVCPPAPFEEEAGFRSRRLTFRLKLANRPT